MSEMTYEYDNFAASTPEVVDGVYIVKHGITYKLEMPADKMRFTKRVNVLTGEVYYPSNADRLRSMTDEELADFMWGFFDCNECPAGTDFYSCCKSKESCTAVCLEWLKQEVDNG